MFGAAVLPQPPVPFIGLWFYPPAPLPVHNPFARTTLTYPTTTKAYPVPLKAVEVKGSVLDLIAEVEVAHYYENKEKDPIEAM